MNPSPTRPKMLFVLSSERSGSTLLTRMLGRHPAVMAPSELWLLRYPDFNTWRREKPQAIHSLIEIAPRLGLPQDAGALEKLYAESGTLPIYQNLLERAPDGSVIVDKTPAYANETAVLEKSRALDPCYIRLLRHPLGVIDSESRLVQKRAVEAGRNSPAHRLKLRLQRFMNRGFTRQERRREDKWLLQNRNIGAFLESVPVERRVTMVFEDLLLDPENQLAAVCDMLGLAFDPAMLDPFAETADIKPGLGNPNFHTRGRIETAPVDSWRARYSPRQLQPATLEYMRRTGAARWKV
ncbi:MAG TPA: sulfotransferase [Luteolibacter sp.]|nr:sulfotransferase [Luteolibacter sp.]